MLGVTELMRQGGVPEAEMGGWGWSGAGMGWEAVGVKEIRGRGTEGRGLAMGFGHADGWAQGDGIT